MKTYTDEELAGLMLEMRQNGGKTSRRYWHKWRLVLFFSVVLLLSLLFIFAQAWWFFGFVVGCAFGIFSRDRDVIRRQQAIWPLYSKVIDWLKVEKIANGEPSPS